MIGWMQETSPVHQEFAKMNGLCTPNYPPNMFRPTRTHQDEGANLEVKELLKSTLERRTNMKQYFRCNFLHQKGPSHEAQLVMHLQRVGALTKHMLKEREKLRRK
ncbi:hypothetical protein J1N35_044000 [Gossypium stocksii]|uniref:Uncharacterized protein n=1 Tax=Gossypium stocksii TaxID=47602 RepID=A0A9D3U850_9ROSI|nr:hypothetical protein J1N35_044000 [Gossypium stocksii]